MTAAISPRTLSKRLNEVTATEIAGAVRSGATTCEAVVRACLERIEEREPQVQAWQYLHPDQAIEAARALDRAGARVRDAELPADFERIPDAHRWISSFEFSRWAYGALSQE